MENVINQFSKSNVTINNESIQQVKFLRKQLSIKDQQIIELQKIIKLQAKTISKMAVK